MNSSSPLRIRLQPKMARVLIDLPLESVRGYIVLFYQNANIVNEPAPDLDVYRKVLGSGTTHPQPLKVKKFVGI